MQRKRLIRPVPKQLQGVPLKIEYRSTLKLMLRAARTASIERGLQVAAKMDETAIKAREVGYEVPLPSRMVKQDEALRTYFDDIDFPMKSVYSTKEVAAMDAAEAKKKQAAQTAEMLNNAVTAAEGASKIDVGGGQNAISAMLGRQGGGAQQPGAAAP